MQLSNQKMTIIILKLAIPDSFIKKALKKQTGKGNSQYHESFSRKQIITPMRFYIISLRKLSLTE